jgi:hypothetical protein
MLEHQAGGPTAPTPADKVPAEMIAELTRASRPAAEPAPAERRLDLALLDPALVKRRPSA